jgi:molybdenum cofactor synthesis domain-containing protein
MEVALVTVGDELLAGDTVNTNAAWLGRELASRGVAVERATTVPDRIDDIAEAVTEYRRRYDAVIVTGGLGPTHDDLTMAAVARAFDRDLVESEEALDWLAENGGYSHEDLAEGTAHIPEGARPLHNDVGVAPGCVLGTVYVLPGVPAEMEAMFERVAEEFAGEATHVEFVEADEPESGLLDRFETLRERFDVKVGSYPGGTVRVKLEGEREEVERAADWLRANVTAPEPEE